MDRALACDTEPSRERAKALWADGWIAAAQGDTGHALAALEECVDLAQDFDDETTLGHATQFIGLAKWHQGELSEAAQAHEQALAHYRNAGTVNPLTALALSRLSIIVATLGDTERAAVMCQECIAICQARGEQWMRARGLWLRAFARWLQHDLPQVSAHTKEALRLKSALQDQAGVAWCVGMLAWVAAAEDDAQRAAVLFGMGDTLWEQIGGWLSGWGTVREVSSQCRAKARDALGSRAFEAAVQRGESFTLDEAVAYALGEQPPPPAASPAAPELAQLTRREREVATLVAQGMSNKDIATKLVIAQRTAEGHVEHILTKLGFTSRTQITAWIAEQQDS